VYGDGWIKNYGKQGNNLYVNRGIGFSDIPIRINCPPEVTLFTLRSQ
jgi:predicted MPP superfamily phosphohydrolase